jgi:predicted permease
MTFLHELRLALRSLARVKGFFVTIVLTLALGIGANAAIFSVVRGVLLKPLVNRDEQRLIYIRQSAPGLPADNTAFSVPEILDLRERVKSVNAFGEFSVVTFTMLGLGEPRTIRAGVVDGRYFEVLGLNAVLGRTLGPGDDGPNAQGAALLTYRFWMSSVNGDPSVIGKTIRLGSRTATIVGVVEPSVPYPSETELIANIVTSPHHLSATMKTGREHRMTELFGRLAPDATLESARAELKTAHAAVVSAFPEAYSSKARFAIDARLLRDQITDRARTILWVLLAASALVFVIACSNAANLILARSIRREGELAVRAALGASSGALRRTLLAESLVLCTTGAVLGVAIAQPMVSVLGKYAARLSVRALDLSLDISVLWVGVALAMTAAVLLAFVPRLPASDASKGFVISSGSPRMTASSTRRLRVFAVTQVAASFILLAGAGALIVTLMALQATRPGFETTNILAVNVPVQTLGRKPDQVRAFYRDLQRRIGEVPGVQRVAVGSAVPWRDAGNFGVGFQFSVEGRARENGEEDPRAKFRSVGPGFFDALSIGIISGRDFNEADRLDGERVVIVSESLARRMFPNQDALNRRLMWTDSVMQFIGIVTEPRRIVGVVADVDDENITPQPTMTVYHPFEQEIAGGRVFVHASGDPYGLVPVITKLVRDVSADQVVERAATLDDVRAEVMAPDRLNALVFGGFAALAVAIAVVGVAGVLAFSVSGRTREFGIRLAIGSQPREILAGVLREGLTMGIFGVVAGVAGGLALWRLANSVIQETKLPGVLPIATAAAVLVLAAVIASLMPAARASRVDAMQALRSE